MTTQQYRAMLDIIIAHSPKDVGWIVDGLLGGLSGDEGTKLISSMGGNGGVSRIDGDFQQVPSGDYIKKGTGIRNLPVAKRRGKVLEVILSFAFGPKGAEAMGRSS